MSLTVAFLLTTLAVAPASGDLSGRISDEKGNPLPGAVVSLYTAKPRVGIPTTCPSCYRDCAKSAKTDAKGQFSIDDLDPALLFRVLILAPGKQAQLTEFIDPATTKLSVALKSMPQESRPEHMIKGRVLDDQGKPLAGAVVSPRGAKTEKSRWWGATPGVDEAAVTDAEGRFVILSKEPKLGLDLTASARGFAVFPATLFELNRREQEIRMRLGATVSGRLTYAGKPVKARAIGIVQSDRSGGRMVGETTMATDENGQFVFANLPPGEGLVLYSLCDAKSDLPALKTVLLKSGNDGHEKSLGNLELLPGKTLKGRVLFPAGSKIPAGAKLRVSRDPAWDWAEVPLSENGDFTIMSLPPEVYNVSVIAPGFVIDSALMNFQSTGESSFGMRIKTAGESMIEVTVPMKIKGAEVNRPVS